MEPGPRAVMPDRNRYVLIIPGLRLRAPRLSQVADNAAQVRAADGSGLRGSGRRAAFLIHSESASSMRPQIFKTRITELLGIRHPILCGGLGPGVSDAAYVAAVVKAGGMGFIVSSGETDWVEEQVRTCRAALGDLGFGVNIYISRFDEGIERARRLIPLLADNRVSCVETAGASPEPIIPALREAGIKIIHKVPAVKYARSAARLDVDAITVVGADCGGHPGVFMISTMVQAPVAAREIDLPLVVGGGIGTGSQLAAALAMGADAIVMGTRMLVAEELWIHPSYKQFIAESDGTQSVVVKQILRDHHRVLENDSARELLALEDRKVTDFDAYRPHVAGKLAREAYRTGDRSRGMLDFGPAAAFATSIQSVETIFDDMLDGACAAISRMSALTGRQAPDADAVGRQICVD